VRGRARTRTRTRTRTRGRAGGGSPLMRARGEEGSALVEFSYLAILLMVPLVYLVLTLSALQRSAYATTAAVREAARAFVTAPAGSDPLARAQAAADLVLADQGIGAVPVVISCLPAAGCTGGLPAAGTLVRVSLDVAVALPGLPALFCHGAGAGCRLTIPVTAAHVERVDCFADRPRLPAAVDPCG